MVCPNLRLCRDEDATDFFTSGSYTGGTKGGEAVTVYADGVMLLNFLVDLLLILGTNRLTGHPMRIGRASAGAALGGLYSGVCLMPGFRFLCGTLWRIVSLWAMSGIAFGLGRSGLRRILLFVMLSMALGGMAMGIGSGDLLSLVASATALLLFCRLAAGGIGGRKHAVVELRLGDKKRSLTALCDTGNLLTDPVTGEAVTVAGGHIAREMLGLTSEELADPIATTASGRIPGLRLIPYRAVGQPSGMLLAVKMDEVRINGVAAGKVVAFAPDPIRDDGYEALIGGTV